MSKRRHPLFSPLALVFTALFWVVVLAYFSLRAGGMFSPGALITTNLSGETLAGFTNHAEFQNDCQRCHEPFGRDQTFLCTDCHTNISTEMQSKKGVHGEISFEQTCFACHSDHKGENFDALIAAREMFDHSHYPFKLIKHEWGYQSEKLECASCHHDDPEFSASLDSCIQCHQGHDPDFMSVHTTAYGEDCLICHDGSGEIANFDHGRTGFPLEGIHADTQCKECHTQENYADLPNTCAGCHEEPPIHFALFPNTCETCHTASGWTPAFFDNAWFAHDESGFTLIHHEVGFQNEILSCATCHPGATQSQWEAPAESCIQCHQAEQTAFMNDHIIKYGKDCISCHDGSGEMANFDHSIVFPLEGGHAEVVCEACHIDQQFSQTPTECYQCHEEPVIHAGVFGLQCEACHTVNAWSPAKLLSHQFPLDHGESGQVACETCHPNVYTEYTCYGCHEHNEQNTIREHDEVSFSRVDFQDCAVCHPTGEEDDD